MNIKTLFTQSYGQLIAEVTENLDGTVLVKNPCSVQIGQNQVGLVPLLSTVKETELLLAKDEVKSFLTPVDELRNHFSAQFGSGIQLLTSPGEKAGDLIL